MRWTGCKPLVVSRGFDEAAAQISPFKSPAVFPLIRKLRVLILFAGLGVMKGVLLAEGTGLTGQYYDNASFGTLKTTRTDATVNFNWGTGIPSGTAITNADTFSVVWSGQVEPEFTEPYTFYVTADDGARVWVDDRLVALRTFAQGANDFRGQVSLTAGRKVNVRLEYIEQTGSASVKLEWSSPSRAREVIPAARLYPSRVEKAGGSLLKEHWSGVAGTTLASLTSNANYPSKPGGREFIATFECLAQNWADNYGTRVTGFIVPPVSGSYTFAVSGDEVCELRLSTDSTAANAMLVASVSAPTSFRQWNAQPSQQSAPRALVQGQRYYVELLHKEGAGNDHWSVGWMKPGDAAFSVIPGGALVQPRLTDAQPAQANLLDTMARDHPRIFATAERFAALKAVYQDAATTQQKTWAQNAINTANTILSQAPVAYTQDIRGTILSQSRTAKDRMYALGVAWQITGDSQYAERAWTELSAVAAFPDWHPAHFLDTAEMTHACAIGYDWFYQYWTQTRRDTIRNAIINFGLNAGLSQYTGNSGWSQSGGNNWNFVCNGGMTIGALAVGTENESLTENILNRALNSTRPVWKHFTADDGAWYEGPGYWGYATEYGIRMMAALGWVLGSDFGISATSCVSETGFTPILLLGTANVVFNFADAGAGGAQRGPVLQWLARRYNQPIYDWWEDQGNGGPLDALWWNASTSSPAGTATPPDMAFHGDAGTAFQPQEVVAMRGRWNDSRATFVGCKGGEMGASHGCLDAGTFVLDTLGKRWFHDLGGDDYALPNYFSDTPNPNGVDRWDYYRLRPEGQNTLTISPDANAGMVLDAVAPLVAYQSEPSGSGSFAIHDLTPVYSGMTRVWRGIRLMGSRNQILVQDEIVAGSGRTVWWFAHYTHPATTVTLDPDGTAATLQQGSERLWCKIVSGGGTFQIMDAAPLPTSPNPAGQNANTGYRKLAINLTGVTNTTLAVWFVPLSNGQNPPTTLPAISALNAWNIAEASDPPAASDGGGALNGDNAVDIDLRAYVTDDATPADQMRFSVSNGVNGSIVLLADGHTARFTPTPGFTGLPQFDFTVTDTTPDPRVVLEYDFDPPDASALNVTPDVSSNGRDGTIDVIGTGAATLVTDVPAALGRSGRSMDLAENGGANAARITRVLAASEVDFNSGNWSITGWFRRRDTQSDDMVWHLNNGDGYGGGEELYLIARGTSSLELHHYPGPDVSIATSAATAGVWHHFAVIRSGGTLGLYLDGTLAGSDPGFTLAIDQTHPLVFGGHTDTSATYAPRWFDGQLDELAVFNAALSPAEISTLAGGMTARHFGGLSATGTITLSATPATHNWTATANGAWTTGANWQTGAAPVSSRGATVQFFNGQTLAGTSVAADQDIGANLQLNILTLAGTASAASSVTIGSGGLWMLPNGVLNPTVNLAATNGSSVNTLSYDVNSPVTLGADTTFTGGGSATFRFNGGLGGPGGLVKSGGSTLILVGDSAFTGDVTVNAGTLQVGNDGDTGSLGSGGVTNNSTLRFDRTGTLVVANTIGGSGQVRIDCPVDSVTKAALGTIEFAGANDFAGNVTINSGILRITNSNALGAGPKTILINTGSSGNPQLHLDGSADPIDLPPEFLFQTSNNTTGAIVNDAGNNIIEGDLSLTGGGGDTRVVVIAGTLTLSGDVAPGTTLRNLRLLGAGSGVITGTIRNGSDTNVLISVTKGDAGTWLLSGNNTHSGLTNIDAGTLMLGSPAALGNGGSTFGNATGGTVITTAGATLDLNGQQGINELITLRGAGVGGNGALVNNSAAPASVAGGVISSISTSAGGVHSAVPEIVIGGGGGSGATAVATLGVTAASFAINGGTTVYSTAPTVAISGGGGTGATAAAVLTGGIVTGITITNAGTGYTSAPAIAFSGGTVTTAGTNPAGTGNANNFTVSGIAVTSPGSGYVSAPTVNFSSGTGTAATANRSGISLATASSIGGSGDIRIDAPISGGNTLTKVGANTVLLTAANTYTGATTISAGRLAVSGSLTSSVTATAGTLAPNGTPSTTGGVAINSGGRFEVGIAGPAAGTQYDQLTVGGTVTLAGALDIIAGPGLVTGTTFTILNKTSAGASSGTFAGKPQGSVFNAGGYYWQISYTGGTGNDIVITLVTALEGWRYGHFGTSVNTGNAADLADPNKDGIMNLLEFFLGRNPNGSNAVSTLPSLVKNGANLEFNYTRNIAAMAVVSHVVEWSEDLAAGVWSTAGVTEQVLADDGTLQSVKANVAAGSGTRRFVRLRVTHP